MVIDAVGFTDEEAAVASDRPELRGISVPGWMSALSATARKLFFALAAGGFALAPLSAVAEPLPQRASPPLQADADEERKGIESALLTRDEQIWLAGHPVIRLGVDKAWPPFESLTP